MKVKAWKGICSKSCWEATETRCRCRCKGRHRGGGKQKRLEAFKAHEEEGEVDDQA